MGSLRILLGCQREDSLNIKFRLDSSILLFLVWTNFAVDEKELK